MANTAPGRRRADADTGETEHRPKNAFTARYSDFPLAENTNRAYKSRWREFDRWCRENGTTASKAGHLTVAQHLTDLTANGKSLATVRLTKAAITAHHRNRGRDDGRNPGRHPAVAAAAERAARAATPQKQANALLNNHLDAIRATARRPRERGRIAPETEDEAETRGTLDIAICTTMRDAGLRRAEAAALTWHDLTIHEDGTGRVRITRSKTNQTGPPEEVAITTQTVQDLLAIRSPDAEPHHEIFGLTPRQISDRIGKAAEAAGLGGGFTGHSGRVGLARTMSRNGAPINITMQQGRWRNAETVARYTRQEDAAAALPWLR